MALPEPVLLVDELRKLPNGEALAVAVRDLSFEAAQSGALQSSEATLEGAQTPHGNAQEILRRGPQTPDERGFIAALIALGLAADESPEQSVPNVLWLATHGSVDAFGYIDAAVGPRAAAFWTALCAAVSNVESGRAEALVAASALCASRSDAAQRAVAELKGQVDDATLLRLLEHRPPHDDTPRLEGEIHPSPRHPAWTVVLGITGLLFLWHLARLVGRLALAYKRPAKVSVTKRGLELDHRTELLGKTLRNGETVVPLTNLAKVTREVKYSRLGLYAGLVALTLGTYLGMGLFVDGMRVPGLSPSLIGLAIVFILLGLLIDFGLSSLSDTVRGRCRLVVTPRKGKTVCIGAVDPTRADAMLGRLAEQNKA